MRRSKATHWGADFGLPATVPTRKIFVCPRATSGNAAAPPSVAMNARRFVRPTGIGVPPRDDPDHSTGSRAGYLSLPPDDPHRRWRVRVLDDRNVITVQWPAATASRRT